MTHLASLCSITALRIRPTNRAGYRPLHVESVKTWKIQEWFRGRPLENVGRELPSFVPLKAIVGDFWRSTAGKSSNDQNNNQQFGADFSIDVSARRFAAPLVKICLEYVLEYSSERPLQFTSIYWTEKVMKVVHAMILKYFWKDVRGAIVPGPNDSTTVVRLMHLLHLKKVVNYFKD